MAWFLSRRISATVRMPVHAKSATDAADQSMPRTSQL
jgi:hypothetical protein